MSVETNKELVRHFYEAMLLRIADGKIIEKRSHVDVHDILRQLGDNA